MNDARSDQNMNSNATEADIIDAEIVDSMSNLSMSNIHLDVIEPPPYQEPFPEPQPEQEQLTEQEIVELRWYCEWFDIPEPPNFTAISDLSINILRVCNHYFNEWFEQKEAHEGVYKLYIEEKRLRDRLQKKYNRTLTKLESESAIKTKHYRNLQSLRLKRKRQNSSS